MATNVKRKTTYAAGSTKKSRAAKPAGKATTKATTKPAAERKLTGPAKPPAQLAMPKHAPAGAIPAAAKGAVAILQQGLPLPFSDNGPHPSVAFKIADLVPSPLNPRWRLPADDKEKTIALAENIDAHGQLQAIMVRPGRGDLAGKHEIAIGFRRYRAIKWLIEQKRRPADFPIMAVVRDMSDAQLVMAAGSENLAREDMHPLDAADIFKATLAHVTPDKGRSEGRLHAAVAKLYGVGVATVHRRLALLRCSREAQDALYKGKLTLGQAQALSLGTDAAQAVALAKILAGEALDEAAIRRLVTGDRIPVAAAPFPREQYTGEIVTDPETGTEYFADPVAFDQLAYAILEKKAAALRSKHRWVEICEGDFDAIYVQRLPDMKAIDPKDAEAGAVVCYDRQNGAIEIVAPALKKTVIAKRQREAKRAEEEAARAAAAAKDAPAKPAGSLRGDDLCIAEARDVLRLYDEAIRGGDAERAEAHADRMEQIAVEMNGGEHFGMTADNGGEARLARALRAPAGAVPLFGQPGTFELRLPEGVRARIETEGLFDVATLGFEAHAIDPNAPFISETGFAAFTIPRAEKKPGMSLPEFVLAEIDRELTAPTKKNGPKRKRQLVAIDDKYRERIAEAAGAAPVAAEPEPEPRITPTELRKANDQAEAHAQAIEANAPINNTGAEIEQRKLSAAEIAEYDAQEWERGNRTTLMMGLPDQLADRLLDWHIARPGSFPVRPDNDTLLDAGGHTLGQILLLDAGASAELAAIVAQAINELASRAGIRFAEPETPIAAMTEQSPGEIEPGIEAGIEAGIKAGIEAGTREAAE